MYLQFFPKYDATIYEGDPERNTGIDQILEIRKRAINSFADDGTAWGNTTNSRILLQFDLSEISSSINSGQIPGTAKYYLKLYTAHSTDLPLSYDLFLYPLAQSWTNGNGTKTSSPRIKNGVSWKYRHSKPDGTLWTTGSGIEMANQTTAGGGAYYTSSEYVVSKSFDYENPDMRVDVTRIVKAWLSGSIANNGLIVKKSNAAESGSSIFGSLNYFSKETQTIYPPRLQVMWDDSDLSGTGSFTEISEDYILSMKNIRPSYNTNSVAKIRMKARDRYPTKAYTTSSAYETVKRLPTSSFYSVKDYATNDTMIPFDTEGTRISCDSRGNYIRIKMNALFPERYYYLIIKIEREGGDVVEYLDNYYTFKVGKE